MSKLDQQSEVSASDATEAPPPRAALTGSERGGLGEISGTGDIYERGALMGVTIEDLVNNPTAIKQLINAHNAQAKAFARSEQESAEALARVRREVASKQGEIEYLRTSPFVAAFAAVTGTLGTIVAGVGVNMATSNPPQAHSMLVIVVGGFLVVSASLANIFFPYALGDHPKPATDDHLKTGH